MTTPLLGPAAVPVEVAAAWARMHGAPEEFVERAWLYYGVPFPGPFGSVDPATGVDTLGIRPEVAYLQHAHETGWGRFGGVVPPEFHNPAGIKVARPGDAPWPRGMTPDPRGSDYNPNAHQRWPDWRAGVQGHYRHLDGYVRGRAGIDNTVVAHERYYLIAGLSWPERPIDTVEELDRWAGGPGSGYGPRLAEKVNALLAWADAAR